ncbi:MAG: nitrogenase stabilizing/protective protein NifW [Acetobacteraceae bacterium]|nr:nitrogenase stabilizing/protective protein NifW [Acetobacteraceae bacterium]
MSRLLDRMQSLSAAEDFFAMLQVPYDPVVLQVARLHILRRMGQYMAEETLAAMTDDAAEEACRVTLQRAYEDFTQSSPLQQRVFKVLKEAVSPQRGAFVALSDIMDDAES